MQHGAGVIFLDRDGTLNEEVNYLHRPEDLRIIPGTEQALRRLKEAGFLLVTVTNQAGVGRGYYPEADVSAFHRYFNGILEKEGAAIDVFYYCPHHPEHGIGAYRKACHCRKPETGMFEQAEYDLAAGRWPARGSSEISGGLPYDPYAVPAVITAEEYAEFRRRVPAIDKTRSFMIGDKLIDTEAGHRFGVRSVLVGTGYGAELRAKEAETEGLNPDGTPKSGKYDYYAENLTEAADWILNRSGISL